MVLQDKYKRATSSRYRATHGGIQSNRQKAKLAAATAAPSILDPSSSSSSSSANVKQHQDFPELVHPSSILPITSQTQLGRPKTDVESLGDHTLASHTPAASFARRQLASNADRYLEPEPDPNLEPEPEIDLTKFVEKQKTRIAVEEEARKQGRGGKHEEEGEEDVDASFEHLFQHSTRPRPGQPHASMSSRGKPTKVFIEDRRTLGLDALEDERKKADASRDLIARFSAAQLYPTKPAAAGAARISRPSVRSKLSDSTAKTSASLSTPKELVLPLDDEDFLDEVLNDSSGTYGKFKRT
ncbi:hypothetical protein PGT21_025173 [Puccinia graminis f. sp. tritici]|uniref:Uncharacterized protein n=1 Tax=Puccinia graminis f. sp. tritici TaxID=56615 RepID=A0A5B0LX34_PUCGR|nr:hypothetical protein PGTUg99_021271 [Puccinia graminis f. sp. tritici]KAA1104499.1 hypothetical protein PGT21_025173 [Puccinia graminis f. sp. tritici]